MTANLYEAMKALPENLVEEVEDLSLPTQRAKYLKLEQTSP